MKKRETRHSIDALTALLLFGVFAVCILAVLLTGAGSYQRLTQRDRETYAGRTAVQYLTTRIRQADGLRQVAVEDFMGVPALVLREDGGYLTRVYCYEGYLMELYTAESDVLEPSVGERILPAEELELQLEGSMLTAQITDENGTAHSLWLSLRCGEGEAG